MNPWCALRRRTLARIAVLGDPLPAESRLATHITRCAECRAAWEQLQQLSFHLAQTLRAPSPSATFTESLWQRIATVQTACANRRMTGVYRALTAVILLAILLGGWFRLRATLPEQRSPYDRRLAVRDKNRPGADISPVRRLPKQAASTPPATSSWTAPGTKGPGATGAGRSYIVHENDATSGKVALVNHNNRLALSRPAQHAPNPDRHLRDLRRRPIADASQIAQETARTKQRSLEQWLDWGVWCEANGDYQGAEEAFGVAFATQPDTEVAFAAGQAAEGAGDMAQALDYYGQILSPKFDRFDRKEPSWNSDRNIDLDRNIDHDID